MSIFICSNVNVSTIAGAVSKCDTHAFAQEGYGNEFEPLLNKNSSFWVRGENCGNNASGAGNTWDNGGNCGCNAGNNGSASNNSDAGDNGNTGENSGTNQKAAADKVLFLVHGDALFSACATRKQALAAIDDWFCNLQACLNAHHTFYISDIVCAHNPYFSDCKHNPAREMEAAFSEKLDEVVQAHQNVFRFNQTDVLLKIGFDKAFSEKLWYLARIPWSSTAQTALATEIAALEPADIAANTTTKTPAKTTANTTTKPAPKKLMVVDLDNTLWGGVVGEVGAQGIELSDEHTGLIYKDVQRQLMRMKDAGVLLAIASKNNEQDAQAPFRENAHMVLHLEDFVSTKINWDNKDKNIAEIASDLNLGLDSFVFLDDNPTERDLIAHSLPEVTVIDFPRDISHLPHILQQTYNEYFKRPALVAEDFEKTNQYKARAARENLKQKIGNFDDYLKRLEIVARQVDPAQHTQRICQLITKTNQFNLTTKRYTDAQVSAMIKDTQHFKFFAYEVLDRFGNNGITALAIVALGGCGVCGEDAHEGDTAGSGDAARIDTFILSCRIMGKNIENFVVEQIEAWCKAQGIKEIFATYVPTKKNAPIKNLFGNLGYNVINSTENKTEYKLMLGEQPARNHFVKLENLTGEVKK